MSEQLILDSLRRRMRAMHSLYEDACATMSIDQVNHVEKEPCLPIAFSLFHYVNMEDAAYLFISGGEPPIWNDDWAAKSPSTTTAKNAHQRKWSANASRTTTPSSTT